MAMCGSVGMDMNKLNQLQMVWVTFALFDLPSFTTPVIAHSLSIILPSTHNTSGCVLCAWLPG